MSIDQINDLMRAVVLASLCGGAIGAIAWNAGAALLAMFFRSEWLADWQDRREVRRINRRMTELRPGTLVGLFGAAWAMFCLTVVVAVVFAVSGCSVQPEPRLTGSDAWFAAAQARCTALADHRTLVMRGCV